MALAWVVCRLVFLQCRWRRAYSAFANEGNLPNQSYCITKITDASGNVIAQNKNPGSHRIISTNTAKEMTSMLLGVFTSGTGRSAQPANFRVAGKTGSTEVPDSYWLGTKDQWIVGYTPDVDFDQLGLVLIRRIKITTWKEFLKQELLHLYKSEVRTLAAIYFANAI